MSDEIDWNALIAGLRTGDAGAARAICQEYLPTLELFADRHLALGMRQRIGPEDVVQSACQRYP